MGIKLVSQPSSRGLSGLWQSGTDWAGNRCVMSVT